MAFLTRVKKAASGVVCLAFSLLISVRISSARLVVILAVLARCWRRGQADITAARFLPYYSYYS